MKAHILININALIVQMKLKKYVMLNLYEITTTKKITVNTYILSYLWYLLFIEYTKCL
jgi:hypothetical protein